LRHVEGFKLVDVCSAQENQKVEVMCQLGSQKERCVFQKHMLVMVSGRAMKSPSLNVPAVLGQNRFFAKTLERGVQDAEEVVDCVE
jgi:hypothetical protein